MDMQFNFEPVYPHHDLLIELGRVEMAMESLQDRDESERGALKPRLESHRHHLLDKLQRLAV
jgi:hypothetical protein